MFSLIKMIFMFYRNMLNLMFFHRRIIHPSLKRALVLNKVITAGDGVSFSTCPVIRGKDDDLKNDPDVKDILKEFKSDFKDIIKQEEHVADDKVTESSTETPPNNSSSGKNISQLLSELYGTQEEKKGTPYSSIGGYKEYVDSDSTVIYDIDEEREIMRKAYLEGKPVQLDKKAKPSQAEKYSHLAHKRGERGVFDIEELVEVLKAEKILDVAVITIPASRQYADYMVVGTARNTRHLRTVSSLIVSLFKKKRFPEDVVPKREGELDTNTGWTALDMSNIVLHLLVQEKREYYDLETLWTVGPDFDENTRNLMASDESTHKIDTLEDLMAATDVDMDELFGRKDTV